MTKKKSIERRDTISFTERVVKHGIYQIRKCWVQSIKELVRKTLLTK